MLSLTQVQEPYLITIDERLWAGVVIHVVLCGLTWWLSRESDSRRAWLIALAPSSAVLLSLYLVTAALPEGIGTSLGLLSLPLFGLIWIALIAPLAYDVVRAPRSAGFLSLRLIALLNLSCLLCFVDTYNF